MQFYDILNGDADGLCALHQLRLAEPRAGIIVTGAKREIELVQRVAANAGDELSVLDIALERNAEPLARLLDAGATCRYFDHHSPAGALTHPRLQTFIDTAPDICTSLIVDRYLAGKHRAWAVVGAFGDNLVAAARAAAASLALDPQQLARLKDLGECLDYNAHGDSMVDLHYHPADLYETLAHYTDPFDFITGEPVLDVLHSGYADDLYRAGEVAPMLSTERCALLVLPDAAWSRRASGPLVNRLAHAHPERAHAVLTPTRNGAYRASVRAPVARPRGADSLCREFAGGGGRAAAAGVDELPAGEVERFAAAFAKAFARSCD
jgi:hypothetical protein